MTTLEPGDKDHATLAIHSVRDSRIGGIRSARASVGTRHGQDGRCASAGSGRCGSTSRCGTSATNEKEFQYFSFTNDPAYGVWEKISLWVVLGIAIAGLVYALGLVNQVVGADEGTERMRDVAQRSAREPTPIWAGSFRRSPR